MQPKQQADPEIGAHLLKNTLRKISTGAEGTQTAKRF